MSSFGVWRIFRTFLALGSVAFGGPAIIAHLREVLVRRRGWVTPEAFEDGLGLCQSLPGATGMQLAGYLGLRLGGVRGALAAFVGFGLPAFVLMVMLSAVYCGTRDVPAILAMFAGMQAVVVALVGHAAWSFGREFVKYRRDILLACAAAVFLGFGGAPVAAIPVSALAGVWMYRNIGDETRIPRIPAAYARRLHAWRAVACVVAAASVGMAFLFAVDRPLFALTATMMRIDLFAFGGGYASLPMMLHEVVASKHWLDRGTLMDGIALGQITPGPIIITATFVGYVYAGLVGAFAATAGIFLPSFVLLLAMAPEFHRLRQQAGVRCALRGAVASFVGLLVATTIRLAVHVPWDASLAVIGGAAFVALLLRVNVPWVVLGGALLAWLW